MRIGQVHIPLILWWATLVHFGLGVAVLLDNQASVVLIIVGLQDVTKPFTPSGTGILLITFATIAALGLIFEERLSRKSVIASLFPQYVLLIASFISNSFLIIGGYQNSSGNEIPTSVLFCALWAPMVGAILHTFGIVERYFWKWPKSSQS